MRTFKIILIAFIGILIVIGVTGLIIKNNLSKRALPNYNGTFKMPELKDEVEVYRDSFAIPHIYAKNEADLYFITGYLNAQDRMWQMDLMRRLTEGRLCEIFGEKMLNVDVLMRMLQIPQKSRKMLEKTDSSVLIALNAYANGVNKYIEENQKSLPFEFAILGYKPEKWLPEHSLDLIGYIAWDLNGSWNSEVLLHQLQKKLTSEQLKLVLPQVSKMDSVIYPNNSADWSNELSQTSKQISELGLQVFNGSNNWAIGGKLSKSGKPILANDMHLGLRIPGVWYQIHQEIPGKLKVTGVLLPGQPFVVSGHNDKIAWGMTNVMNDDIDFYRETINPNDTNQYKLDGQWKSLKITTETINMKGKGILHKIIKYTHRGPLISEIKGITNEEISMHWLGNENSNEVRSIYYVNHASDWTTFKDAMKSFISVSQNVVYADTAGNIGLYCCAGIPIRNGADAIQIMPGDTSLYDWKGLVPFAELPHVYNPACNYVISANNKTINDSYPYYISNWFDYPYRYNRIKELITSEKQHTVETDMKIQTDQKSYFAKQYVPKLVSVLRNQNLNKTEKILYEKLLQWDYNYDAENCCPLVFEYFYNTFISNAIKDEIGDTLLENLTSEKIIVRSLFHNIWTTEPELICDNVKTPEKETFNDLVTATFKQTITELTEKFGDNIDKWHWGSIHTFTLEHPIGKVKIMNSIFHLNRGPYETGGSFHTVAPYTYMYSKPYEVTSGASQRHIYDLSNWDNSKTVIPTGNCGIISSPHYCDQTPLYLQGKYHKDLFSVESVKVNTMYKAFFKPN